MIKRCDKRGASILTENVIFIVLNIVFISILVLFLFMKMGTPAVYEEMHAKQIAMILDSARPGMEVSIDMTKALKQKDKNWDGKIVTIDGNVVTVKLREDGGYSYSFFNNVALSKDFFYGPSDDSSRDEGNKFEFVVEAWK